MSIIFLVNTMQWIFIPLVFLRSIVFYFKITRTNRIFDFKIYIPLVPNLSSMIPRINLTIETKKGKYIFVFLLGIIHLQLTLASWGIRVKINSSNKMYLIMNWYTNLPTSRGYIFLTLQHLHVAPKLGIFKMLFWAVVEDFDF